MTSIKTNRNYKAMLTLSIPFFSAKLKKEGFEFNNDYEFEDSEFPQDSNPATTSFKFKGLQPLVEKNALLASIRKNQRVELTDIRIISTSQKLFFLNITLAYLDTIGTIGDAALGLGQTMFRLNPMAGRKLSVGSDKYLDDLKSFLRTLFESILSNGDSIQFFFPRRGDIETISLTKTNYMETCFTQPDGIFFIHYQIVDNDYAKGQLFDEIKFSDENSSQKTYISLEYAMSHLAFGNSIRTNNEEYNISLSKELPGSISAVFTPYGSGFIKNGPDIDLVQYVELLMAHLSCVEKLAFCCLEQTDLKAIDEIDLKNKTHIQLYKRAKRDLLILDNLCRESRTSIDSSAANTCYYGMSLKACDFSLIADSLIFECQKYISKYEELKKDSIEAITIVIAIFAIISAFKDGSDLVNSLMKNWGFSNIEDSLPWYIFLVGGCFIAIVISISLIINKSNNKKENKIKDEDINSIL